MGVLLSLPIELRANRRGEERAYVAGSRVRVQDIALDYERHGQSADEIARELPVSLAAVHAALAFYFANRDAVLEWVRSDAAFAERREHESPGGPS
ncbi:MAG: DUF433 domain-containing protein [Lacipirellulaceae bacterium]